ncbi:hypothetical protein ABZY90_08490 [Streptomyces sp. NPDC006422]|uniref:hypothetical protein n=1 Tax=unclassified Streptomyces TaxID=2593676 RepID=UPI0033A60E69
MSWQQPDRGAEPVVPEVVYDPQQAAHAYDGYVDPAAAHGWQEPADASGDTAPLPPVPAKGPAHARGRAVFADGSGRRRRLMRVGGIALGGVCVVFLGAVVTGLFGAGPTGGPLPWSGDDDGKKPRAEHSAPASTAPAPDPTGSASSPGPSAAATGTASASPKGKEERKAAAPTGSPSRTTTAAPTATASTTAPARGNSENKPGRGNASPGAGKGPK